MDLAVADTADARNRMVDSQVRPNKVNDRRVLDTMRVLPREQFLPPSVRHLAYADGDVPLGGGRVLMEPMLIARLVQLARPRAGESALVVGAGSGYGAALLAACGVTVIALEQQASLLAIARAALAVHAPAVSLVQGPLDAGWPDAAPYDLILIEGAVRAIPAAASAQLKPAGRLVTVLTEDRGAAPFGTLGGTPGQAVLAEHVGSRLRARPAFDCATPQLPELQPPPRFVF